MTHVPEGWKRERLGKFCEFQRGFDLPTSQRIEGSYPIISSSGISGYHNEYKAEPIGIVTGRYGTIGQLFYVEEPYWPLNTSLWVKDFKGNYPKFLYYMLSRFNFKKFSDKTGVPGVNRNDLHAVRILVPPLPEQKKIAEILGTWDAAIAAQEKLITNSETQKKALMQQLLTGKKRLQGFSGAWEKGCLEDLCVFKGGSAFKEKHQGKKTGEIPFVKVSDMNLPENSVYIVNSNNWISKKTATEIKANIFDRDAVVFAKVGAALLLNRRRILTRDTIIDNNMMAAIPRDGVNSYYLYQILLVIDFAKLAQEGALPSVNQSSLGKFKLHFCPNLKEQTAIAAILSDADREITLQQQKLATLKQEKAALMQQLLTGKRRVTTDKQEKAA